MLSKNGIRKDYLIRFSIFLLVFLGVSLACMATASGYENPSKDMKESDLVGVWETHYGKNTTDTITILDDGIYKQKYQDTSNSYVFETDWSPYWLENRPDGSVYIHFEGGRHYSAGEKIGELDGISMFCSSSPSTCPTGSDPWLFYDPYGEAFVEMKKELILTIRTDYDGNTVFHHLWMNGGDAGFAIIGGQRDIFHRVDGSNP